MAAIANMRKSRSFPGDHIKELFRTSEHKEEYVLYRDIIKEVVRASLEQVNRGVICDDNRFKKEKAT